MSLSNIVETKKVYKTWWSRNVFLFFLKCEELSQFDQKVDSCYDLIRVVSADAKGYIFAPVVMVLLSYANRVPAEFWGIKRRCSCTCFFFFFALIDTFGFDDELSLG